MQELPQGALDARIEAGAVRLFLEQMVGTEAVYCLHLLADREQGLGLVFAYV